MMPAPSSMLSRSSELLDVEAHGGDLALTSRSKTERLATPSLRLLLAQTAVLACLAVAGSAVGRLIQGRTQRPEF